ncbi:MAG: class I SAM-dependent methyltransferase [Chthoniobacterales bacterium]
MAFFYKHLPDDIRAHRRYFNAEQRGFGEEAFHVMWWMLFREFRPRHFLEIGVYRGQTLSLAALLQRKLGIEGSVTGISPFTSSGDAVSQYRKDLDYRADTLANFVHFNLTPPNLVKAYSTDPAALEAIGNGAWDCIYIDGNHDYEVALADLLACSRALQPGGILVLDDSGLSTSYLPPAFATGGHPGPSQVASEIEPKEFEEILQVGHNRVFRKLA